MIIKKATLILIIIITSISIFIPNPSVTSFNIKGTDNSETHVIENVPLICQEESCYCEIASVEMVLRYYGLNISQTEILYDIGGAYSMGYKPKLKTAFTPPIIKTPHKFRFWTDETTGGTDDYKFLATLHGLSFENIYPKYITNHEKCWNEYWPKVKNYIKNDTPVVTGVDLFAWPPFLELINISFTIPRIFAHTHIIVVLGFNETNESVCIHDPYLGYLNNSQKQKGFYRWIDKNDFKKAVGRIKWELKQTQYQLLVFEKTSNNPIPEELAAELIHERNIEKMMGLKSAYDEDFLNKNFHLFGINALKELKKDLQNSFLIRIPLFRFIDRWYPFTYAFCNTLDMMKDFFMWESINKNHTSQYLLENINKSEHHEEEGLLLEIESKHWETLWHLASDLESTILKNLLIKAIKISKSILDRMISTLSDIIVIQNMVIKDT